MGASNKSLIEFKLASNRKLKQNLAKQVVIYEKANEITQSIKVIVATPPTTRSRSPGY